VFFLHAGEAVTTSAMIMKRILVWIGGGREDRLFAGNQRFSIVWNPRVKKWWMYYTDRRANVPGLSGVTWVHGTPIGIAESADGGAHLGAHLTCFTSRTPAAMVPTHAKTATSSGAVPSR